MKQKRATDMTGMDIVQRLEWLKSHYPYVRIPDGDFDKFQNQVNEILAEAIDYIVDLRDIIDWINDKEVGCK